MILTAGGKGFPHSCSVLRRAWHPRIWKGVCMRTVRGGGNCRISLGVGMLYFESDVVWSNDVHLLGFVSLVFLCYFWSDKLDKYREAWGRGLVFWVVSGFRCTRCYQDYL